MKHILKRKLYEDILNEDTRMASFMSKKEMELKKKLLSLLVRTHHAKYALRLKDFDVHILTWLPKAVRNDERYIAVAAVSWDYLSVYINEGMLVDMDEEGEIFQQLVMLIRHELAHSILLHTARMCRRLPNSRKLYTVYPVRYLLNVLEDAEISNRIYTPDDKAIVRNTTIGVPKAALTDGRSSPETFDDDVEVIKGILTDDIRPEWVDYTLEEMLDALEKEIKYRIEVLRGRASESTLVGSVADKSDLTINGSVMQAYAFYQDINGPSSIQGTLDEFEQRGYSIKKKDKPLVGDFKKLATAMCQAIKATKVDDTLVSNLLNSIADSGILSSLDITIGSKIITLDTPIEKYLACEILKKIRSEYSEWFDKVMSKIASYRPWNIYKILDGLGLRK